MELPGGVTSRVTLHNYTKEEYLPWELKIVVLSVLEGMEISASRSRLTCEKLGLHRVFVICVQHMRRRDAILAAGASLWSLLIFVWGGEDSHNDGERTVGAGLVLFLICDGHSV